MRYPVSELAILNRLRGKSVALVGAAESITGTGVGNEIDSHDVVVRVNNGFIFPRSMSQDLGTRTDFVYHTGVTTTSDGEGEGLNPIENGQKRGVRNIDIGDVDTMIQAGVQGLFLVVAPTSRRVRNFTKLPPRRFNWTRFSRDYRTEIQRKIGTLPNTGVLAAWHLLRSELSDLCLYGFDFFTTPHHAGYNDETEEYRVTAGSRPTDEVHDQEKQVSFVGDMWSRDSRLSLPPLAEQRVRAAGWSREE